MSLRLKMEVRDSLVPSITTHLVVRPLLKWWWGVQDMLYLTWAD